MRLGIRLLDDVIDFNTFRFTDELFLTKGNSSYLYFQLVSIRGGCDDSMFRYIPTVAAEVNVKFMHLDSNKEIVRVAEMPFPDEDRSIWRVEIQATDEIAPDSIFATLTEAGKTQRLVYTGTLRSTSTDTEQFFC